MIFRFVCRAEVNITMDLSLQFRQRQHNPSLGLRGWVRESITLQLVGAVPSIQYMASTAGYYLCSTTIPITIQWDCASPWGEFLTGSQDSWSRQQNRLRSLGSMSRRMVIWEEVRVWQDLASVFCLFSVCFINGLVFYGRDNALEEC